MHWDWETIKGISWWAYRKAAQIYLSFSIFLWVLGSIVAGHPILIGGYVNFVWHVFHWGG
jgi:hypothetical protein